METLQSFLPNLDRFFMVFIPALIGIILHEVAHGYVAYLHGDPTAKQLGRLTLNPIKHLDPTGTLVFIATALFSPLVFGWAKPVPVQSRYFKNPNSAMRLVSIAGPLANFFVALCCAFIVAGILLYFDVSAIRSLPSPFQYIALSAYYGVTINCVLAWFNLMPLPPLDGSHIISSFLPASVAQQYARIGRYGILILLALVYFNVLGKILWPLVDKSTEFLFSIVHFIF